MGGGRIVVSNASCQVDARHFPHKATLNISGEVSMLGITSHSEILVNQTGLQFEMTGMLKGLFKSDFKVSLKMVDSFRYEYIGRVNVLIKGNFRQDLFSKLETGVRNSLEALWMNHSDAQTQVSNATIRSNKAEKEFNEISIDVSNERQALQNASSKLQMAKDNLNVTKSAHNKLVIVGRSLEKLVCEREIQNKTAMEALQNAVRTCPRQGMARYTCIFEPYVS